MPEDFSEGQPESFSEDLLGYLLGALEPHEMDRVARWLQESPEARRQLGRIESSLRPLEENYQPPESPPLDLVARTLASLPPRPNQVDQKQGFSVQVNKAFADKVSSGLSTMSSGVETPHRSHFSWMDWAASAVAAAVLLGLFLPAIMEGRFEARKVACQDQLRQLGTALTQYVSRDYQNRLPAVAKEGPEAFAGVYAMRLNDAGLLIDGDNRWCPSFGRPTDSETTLTKLGELVSVNELHDLGSDRLRELQQFAGGHYAYSLGVVDGKTFESPKFESRSSFAVMSDAPSNRFVGSDMKQQSIGHSGFGINVLYEDGRVQFLSLPSLNSIPDHPWLNNRGDVEAGVNIDDASLAPSWRPPFLNVRQR